MVAPDQCDKIVPETDMLLEEHRCPVAISILDPPGTVRGPSKPCRGRFETEFRGHQHCGTAANTDGQRDRSRPADAGISNRSQARRVSRANDEHTDGASDTLNLAIHRVPVR
jgi:hypothetical protein